MAKEDIMSECHGVSRLPSISLPSDASERPSPAPQIEGYDIVAELGRGGMGTVWRAVQRSTRRTIALTVLPAGRCASAKDRARFEREVELYMYCSCMTTLKCTASDFATGGTYAATRPRTQVREYTITLKGTSATDSAVSREIREAVRVRNDKFIGACPNIL